MQEALFAELAAGARSFACGGPSNAGGLPTTSLRRARKRRHCARSLKHDGGSGSAVFSSTRPMINLSGDGDDIIDYEKCSQLPSYSGHPPPRYLSQAGV